MSVPDEDVKKEFIKKETKKKDESDFYFEITVRSDTVRSDHFFT